ncbi:cytochrome P450 4V2 [Trichonephila clavipes]|nr:cytochrome P450 4V2 [Trichonephila clavipes]
MDDNAPCHRTVDAEQLLESRRLAARTLPPVTIRELRLALQKNGQQCLNNSLTPSFSAWADAMETCLAVREIISPTKDRIFLAGHPSQGCFGLQSHMRSMLLFQSSFFLSPLLDFSSLTKENQRKQAFLLGVDQQWSCHVERYATAQRLRGKTRRHVLVKQLRNEITKDSTDISMPITLCSLDIICETTLGVSIGAQENSDSQYIKSVSRAADIIVGRMITPWHWFDFLFYLLPAGRELKHHLKVLHDFTRSVIKEKKKKLLSGEKNVNEKRKRKALMDVLLEHHIQMKDLTEEDIREEVDTFAFEGHDTTATGIYWALYNIGLNKDVQEKIHEELDRIFGDDTERPVNTEDLKDMIYLDRVIKESQRLYPSVPVIARRISENTNICGYPIPEGSSCIVFVHQLHRDETVFPNPEKFDPDHFLPENSANRHPYAYIPFSAGPRNCIGQRFAVMEEKVLISAILRNYTIESLCHRDKLPPAVELILRSSKPILQRIRPRQRYSS